MLHGHPQQKMYSTHVEIVEETVMCVCVHIEAINKSKKKKEKHHSVNRLSLQEMDVLLCTYVSVCVQTDSFSAGVRAQIHT